jgi:prophage antirepressor-like protein
MKTKNTDTTMITSTEKATDKVARAFYSSMDEMLAHDFEDMKKIATAPTKKAPAYADPRQALRDIEEHSKTPQDVIAELDAEEAAEKAAAEKKITVEATSTSLSLLREESFLEKTVRVFGTPEEPLFLAKDVAEWIDYNISSVNKMLANVDEDEKTTRKIIPTGSNYQTEAWFLTENGLYEVLMLSRKPKAKEFKKKVKEILKTIRKTGGYINQGQEDLFIDTYMPFLDENYKNLFKLNLQALDQQNKTIRKQKVIIETQKQDIKDFQKALDAYTKDVPLATKRMLINRLIRFPGTNFGLRWMVLYREFDNVYHMNVKARMNKYNVTHTPMCKSQMEFIDLHLGMINELFDLAVKLFKSDYEALIQQMYDAREIDFDSINLN